MSQKKLAELERRQREIADELKQLREEPEKREPEAGDVFDFRGDGEPTFYINGCNKLVWLPGTYGEGSRSDPDDRHVYLGKFDDVFIRKDRVAEILRENRDLEGDNLFKLALSSGNWGARSAMDAFAKEGITE